MEKSHFHSVAPRRGLTAMPDPQWFHCGGRRMLAADTGCAHFLSMGSFCTPYGRV